MDAYFATVSLQDRPDLKDKPVAVCHSSSGTGEISSANYIARKFGIRAGNNNFLSLKLQVQ